MICCAPVEGSRRIWLQNPYGSLIEYVGFRPFTLKQVLTTVVLDTTSIGSFTRASYQSSVPLMRLSSGCANGELKARPMVQVSPRSFFRSGLPMISAEPPPLVNTFGFWWNSEALPPPEALITAEHNACRAARFGFAATLDVLPG